MKNISIIAAVGANYEIGKNNDLLWHIPADLKRFMQITSGHTVIMGRSTFESINKRPLKNRRNIIITSQISFNTEGIEVAHSVEEVMKMIDNNEENFILGGSLVYRQFLPFADKMYLTHVHKSFDADTYFPEFDLKNWKIESREDITNDAVAGTDYSFVNYIRK
ncbi:MAG: dihydrofolate reductase [Bacteroidales bacterium]|nr:dihydrofolate reductase [Bacteroidales bacterium]